MKPTLLIFHNKRKKVIRSYVRTRTTHTHTHTLSAVSLPFYFLSPLYIRRPLLSLCFIEEWRPTFYTIYNNKLVNLSSLSLSLSLPASLLHKTYEYIIHIQIKTYSS